MSDSESRPLHLHTLDSLIADLVSGRPVRTGAADEFLLPDERTRSALEWYRGRGPNRWVANVSAQHGEDLVDAILGEPPELSALPVRSANADNRRIRLTKLEAHRFAGLHKFGKPEAAPSTYVHEFTSPLTLFEGRNGSGKTSLLNAIIWALTGEMLRAQREPETAEDFDCWVAAPGESDDSTVHKLSPLTPMPNVEQYRPDQSWVPADTWVELTFTDEAGEELPIIRRSQSRSARGKLSESKPDLSVLGIDPIGVRIGTVMPGLLPLIKVGSESELGRAVSQLTGLSALVDLTEHVRRAKRKIDADFTKSKTADLESADDKYLTAKVDLEKILDAHPSLKPTRAVPPPSRDKGIEEALDEMSEHFEEAKAAAFGSARNILGEGFDPAKPALLSDLEKNIGGALERASDPSGLASVTRMRALRQLTPEQLDAAASKIQNIVEEGETLAKLAQDPSKAARSRLYARVATWIEDHPDPERNENICVVCGAGLESAVDPVTGALVKRHLSDAASDARLLAQTLGLWAENVLGDLMRNMPEALRAELTRGLPAHPCDLLQQAIVDELFSFEPFRGVLGHLKAGTATTFDDVVKDRAALADPTEIDLPSGCDALGEPLRKLDHAIRFARWRQENDALASEIVVLVLGRVPKEGEPRETATVTGKLLDLEATVKASEPVSDALLQCGRLKQHLKARRGAEKRLAEYAVASAALGNLTGLGQLADEQVDELRKTLRDDAASWRSRIYLGAFPDTAHELVDTGMGRKGELDLVVEAGGVSAPAQHVTNASALRASLVAFFLAFWEYVLAERGGLMLLLLDDPQELLDDDNRERLATALVPLAARAQLVLASYDPRFCGRLVRVSESDDIEHLEVKPATRQQPVVRTTLPLPAIRKRRALFEDDKNAEEPARDFADCCRVFLESKLGDMFDDPAHAAWALDNPDPTLATFVQRLRPLVKSGQQGMFSGTVFRSFVDHPALADGSAVVALMNKGHHGRRQEITPAEVEKCADELSVLLELVEEMSDECYRWRRRDLPQDPSVTEAPPALTPTSHPPVNIPLCPDLAAFTQHAPSGESQEHPDLLDPHLRDGKVAYYLRRPNFGFAAPIGSLAIVEAVPGPPADRRLVIARHDGATYARRFLRGATDGLIGLTAEVPDPRTRNPKTIFLSEDAVAIHQVVGIIFDHSVTVAQGQDEAVLVSPNDEFERVEIAFRVADDSAVPLALDKQVVLGGKRIELDELGRHEGALVALALDDGSSIFKRVGATLPNELSHLRQFESIGGLGSSQILSVATPHNGLASVTDARIIIGVLYHN